MTDKNCWAENPWVLQKPRWFYFMGHSQYSPILCIVHHVPMRRWLRATSASQDDDTEYQGSCRLIQAIAILRHLMCAADCVCITTGPEK